MEEIHNALCGHFWSGQSASAAVTWPQMRIRRGTSEASPPHHVL